MITNSELAIVDELAEAPVSATQGAALESLENTDTDTEMDTDMGWAQRAYERGMVTAEWAIGVVVAVSLAGLLLLFVVKGPGRELLSGIILKIINQVASWGLSG